MEVVQCPVARTWPESAANHPLHMGTVLEKPDKYKRGSIGLRAVSSTSGATLRSRKQVAKFEPFPMCCAMIRVPSMACPWAAGQLAHGQWRAIAATALQEHFNKKWCLHMQMVIPIYRGLHIGHCAPR